jgi:hypothetical protein
LKLTSRYFAIVASNARLCDVVHGGMKSVAEERWISWRVRSPGRAHGRGRVTIILPLVRRIG